MSKYLYLFSLSVSIFFLTACGGGGDSSSDSSDARATALVQNDIVKFAPSQSSSSYMLEQIDNASFNALSKEDQYKVADKLLTTLFYAYPYGELKTRVDSNTFISDIRNQLLYSTNNMDEVEAEIHDTDHYYSSDSRPQNIMLSRFALMKDLDKNFFNHWMSYILTQTILFSPASELDTVSYPDAYAVYNRLYYHIEDDVSMRYSTFEHMMSDENWRRFRSSEDNGREMLEIYALDGNDADVPIAAQALKNWHLSRYADTLVVSQERNTEPLSLLGDMQFTTGVDFYSALANSSAFTKGVTTRLVRFMFTNTKPTKQSEIISKIVSSKPEAWSDILQQIVFSKEYLLHTQRAKSIEELTFSLMKKLSYNPYYYTFNNMSDAMDKMGQSSMKYKLGKITRVPLDDISFAFYQDYLRNRIFRTRSIDATLSYNPHSADNDTKNSAYIMSNYKNSSRRGVSSKIFMAEKNYVTVQDDANATNTNYINYVFNSTLNRKSNTQELGVLLNHISQSYYYKGLVYENQDKDYEVYARYSNRNNFNYLIFEYILRTDELYFFKEIN